DQILRSLDVGKITGGSAAFDTFVADSIVGRVATLIELDVSHLVATSGTINELVVDLLWTDVVRAGMLTATEAIIGGAVIKDGAIQGHHVEAISVAAEIGEFVNVKAENILAGNINVALNLTAGGAIRNTAGSAFPLVEVVDGAINVYGPE